MQVQNRWGTAIDPVPFLVVAITGFATCYSFGPVYLLTFDITVPSALALSTASYGLVTAVAYYRLVWTYRPAYRREVPVGVRFRRIVLASVAAIGVLALFALPLVVQ